MKGLRLVLAFLLALVLVAMLAGDAVAEGESITITIDRKTMPQSVLHPGRFFTEPETVTVYDYVIRNYSGKPIDGFIVQTSSGQTKVPVATVKEIRTEGWVHRRTADIEYVENVVRADMLLTDDSQMSVLMNADFGTIEGKTDLGDFFLKDPHTVRHLVFNRPARLEKVSVEKDKPPTKTVVAKVDKEMPPPDTDGDGVPDYEDRCPDTPKGASVNSVGCWTIKGIHFDYNKWDIRPQYYGVLDENSQVLAMNPMLKVEIQGHTDSIASEEYNQILSERRADSVRTYFASKGISQERVSIRGFGELKPIASNETDEGRAKNRRIEIKIISR